MKKSFPVSLDHLYSMLLHVKEQLDAIGFHKNESTKIELATEEALVNIFSHSGLTQEDKLEIECSPLSPKKGISIKIIDPGQPYNPLQNIKIIDPHTPLEERNPGGFGIYLIVKLMDKVDYVRDDNKNVLTLIKYL